MMSTIDGAFSPSSIGEKGDTAWRGRSFMANAENSVSVTVKAKKINSSSGVGRQCDGVMEYDVYGSGPPAIA